MSAKDLFSTSTLNLNRTLGKAFGVGEAILLDRIHGWLVFNEDRKMKDHFIDGKWWCYNTYEDWAKDIEVYSDTSCKRYLTNLEDIGIIESTDRHNPNTHNRTKWYTVNYSAYETYMALWKRCGEPIVNGNRNNDAYQRFLAIWNVQEVALTDDEFEANKAYLVSLNTLSGQSDLLITVESHSNANTAKMSTSLASGFAAAFAFFSEIKPTCAYSAPVQAQLFAPEPNLPKPVSPYKAIVTTATEAEVVDEKPNKTKGGRKRAEGVTSAECINPMKAAIMKAFGWSWKTAAKNEKGQVNGAAKQLCDVDFPVEQISALYEFCAEKFDKFGPMALTTNQSEFRKEHKPKRIAPELLAPQKKALPVPVRSAIEEGWDAVRKLNIDLAYWGVDPSEVGRIAS